MQVMRKHWHEHWNADVVGILRGDYKMKALGLRVGKGHVRKVMSEQLGHLSKDLKIPTLIGETGIPFNLDESIAYKNGDYTSHIKALDAILSGCDYNLLNYTLWAYSAINCHEWGDRWNGEDLSIHCSETKSFPNHPLLNNCRAPAAWCRPYPQSLTGTPLAIKFDLNTSKFELKVQSDVAGYAIVYVPWLHYRDSDDSEQLNLIVEISEGDWALDGQSLRWNYERGGTLKIRRAKGALTPKELGTIVE
jgi:hypothetical protein